MQPIMTYLLLPLTELAIDTIMVDGHLPPDSFLDQERVFDRFYKKNEKKRSISSKYIENNE